MENATKALLIAAAILIAIVVITLGVFVLGKGSTLVKDNSDMSDVEISTYNSKFEAYFGTNVRGAQVNQLISAINQHNKANGSDESKRIIINQGDFATDGKKSITARAQTGKAYTVEVDTSDANGGYTTGGLIKVIKITENSNANAGTQKEK